MRNEHKLSLALICVMTLFLCNCSTTIDVKPERLYEHEGTRIVGAALEAIVTGATLNNECAVHFDSLGGVYYNGEKAIRGRTWDGTDTAVSLTDIKYIHVASCDTTQCVAYSMDVPSLRAKNRLWQALDDGGKVPPVELIEFDSDGGTHDMQKQVIIARTQRGQDVEFRLSHIRYLRITPLKAGTRPTEVRLHGKLGFSALSGLNNITVATERRTPIGFSAGLAGRRRLRSGFCFQAEVNLAHNIGEITRTCSDIVPSYVVTEKIKLTRLELPVLARLRVVKRNALAAHIYSGGYFAVNLEAVVQWDSTVSYAGFEIKTNGTSKISNANNGAVGLIMGCDFEYAVLGMTVSLDARYAYGLTSLLDKQGNPLDLDLKYRPLRDEAGEPYDFRVNQLSLAFGVNLF